MMTAARSFQEAQSEEQAAKVIKANVCIAPATENLLERLLVFTHRGRSLAPHSRTSIPFSHTRFPPQNPSSRYLPGSSS